MSGKRFVFLLAMTLFIGVVASAGRPALAASTTPAVADDRDRDRDDDDARAILVDNDKVQCPNAQFTSIQAAVIAAPPGATILVCPGTYPETVKITKPLTIRGIRVGNENLILIMPPIAAANTTSLSSGLPTAAIISVEHTRDVTLQNLTVDGASNTIGACAPNFVGIFYRNSSGRVDSVAVRNIRLFPDALLGCQSGIGIFAQSGNEAGVRRGANLEVFNSSIHDYQKGGIVANEAGTVLTAAGNAVSGFGPTPLIAQNGIQIGFGAKGRIDHNSVINNDYSACTATQCNFTASNILVFSAVSGVQIVNNTLGKSQVNIFFGGEDFDPVTGDANSPITNGLIEGNTILDSDVFDGIDIFGNNNTVHANSIFNSDEAAVYIQGNRNRIVENMFNEAPIGVLIATGSDNTISDNRFFNIEQRVVPPTASSSATVKGLTTLASPSSGRTVSTLRP